IGRTWKTLRGVVLTHVHTDHWHDSVFGELVVRRIPLWLHRRHSGQLNWRSEYFHLLEKNELLRFYQENQWFAVSPRCRFLPIEVSHDSEPTFAFRIETLAGSLRAAIGYAADLGCANERLLAALTNVDLLAVEFNHDVELQRQSGRPWPLIRRVLSDKGHLSNAQAAALVAQVLQRSQHSPHYLVQLHLSEDCNEPELAQAAIQPVLQRHHSPIQVITAPRHHPSPLLCLKPPPGD
ncbi:MAG: MBL fold metallo-hydrolase, partial [Gemmataceae bacterium]|nr:MBL fold metallo-hydrolase [Gemmataceae bacterium]